jgi:uncharacterized integral membrane protein
MEIAYQLLPELLRLESDTDRRLALQFVRKKAMWRVTVPGSVVLSIVCVLCAANATRFPALGILALTLPIAGAFVIGWVTMIIVERSRTLRSALYQYLKENGVAICIGCGYDLTANVSDRCPECGEFVAKQRE